jgi:hypothetical protein
VCITAKLRRYAPQREEAEQVDGHRASQVILEQQHQCLGGFMATQAGNSGSVCAPGLPFQQPAGFQPADFLYGVDGPWPCPPSDGNACKVAPEVLIEGPHCIPKTEVEEWTKTLGAYYDIENFWAFTKSAIEYASNLLEIPLSSLHKGVIELDILAWYGIERPVHFGDKTGHYPALSDSTFTDMIAHGLLSKLMCKADPAEQDLLNDETLEYWKCDLMHMKVVRNPSQGEFVAPSVVFLSRPRSPEPGQEYDFRVEGIRIFVQSTPGGAYDRGAVLKPGDGKAWQLAKYFALQGALVRVNLIDHPMVHFPFDAINAITKSVLPKSNRVLQLLLPHLLLSLTVDNAVLEGKHSLLKRTGNFPYSPYPAAGAEIRKVFPFYWWGSEPPNNAFPPYQFATEPRQIPSKYGTFLNGYYPPILNFTTGVVASIQDDSNDWEAIRFWADHVASWIPGFPNGQAIYKNRDLLARTCAAIIWNGAIVHTADHWLMHQMFEQKLPTPYVLRDQPLLSPSVGVDPDYRPSVLLIRDAIAARLCDEMFFMPHCTTQLSQFKYEFAGDLGPVIERFKKEMTATDIQLHQAFPEFGISLYADDPVKAAKDCFAAGVQF